MSLITMSDNLCSKCKEGVYKLKGHNVTQLGLMTIYKCDNCGNENTKITKIEGVDKNVRKGYLSSV